ncbi:CGNR zinc finger domain-containing protein [Micromonospora sp. R77]|uniref:CGNR zinc finger domain-containing protein n=1 Tax=Micromonospora sp. R77 TaxID=2925836 RepID=UPI001F62614D|nr:CGNR zinc finger domain-containing protein [Micromonospora sp. R77]MCI4066294.1 CGNR zinc finger domain-containing protein [Micromonospora sp. R77]
MVSTDEDLLLLILNSTPVVDGEPRDLLADSTRARATLREFGGTGTHEEWDAVRSARPLLQGVARGELASDSLAPLLTDACRVPHLTATGLDWSLTAPPDRQCVVRAVLAWADLREVAPGRLRPCANDECRLFLIDRSRANTARWCSMAACGNRLKARRHYRRART